MIPDRVNLFVRTGPDALPALVAHLRSRLPTLWSKSYFVAAVGRESDATIGRYIAEQTTRPEKG